MKRHTPDSHQPACDQPYPRAVARLKYSRKQPAVVRASCILSLCLIGAGTAHADPGWRHDFYGIKLLEATPTEGGAMGLNKATVMAINDWMDNPATKTGQYINTYTNSPVRPSNHGLLRHNPVNVSRVFSGDGSIDVARMNIARLHKVQDIASNTAAVDGWVPTKFLKEEAERIMEHVERCNRLPEKLPKWVDQPGPLVSKVTSVPVSSTPELTSTAKPIAPEVANVSVPEASRLASLAKATGGVLAVAGGGFQCYQGIQEITKGSTAEGTASVVGGVANVTAGGALFAGKIVFGAAAGSAAVVVDGGRDIYVGVRDGDGERITVGGVKAAAGTAMAIGTATCQPEVVIPAAVVYGGVVVYEQKDNIVYAASVAGEWAKCGGDAIWNGAEYALEKTGSAVRTARDAAWNASANAVQKTGALISTKKDEMWNGGAAVLKNLASSRDAMWNRVFK